MPQPQMAAAGCPPCMAWGTPPAAMCDPRNQWASWGASLAASLAACVAEDPAPSVSDVAEMTLREVEQLTEPGAEPRVAAVRAQRLADSAWEYLRYTMAGSARDEADLCRRLGTDARHIMHSKLSAGVFGPAHFVHVNHERRWIVLCIRGTQEWPDLVTDFTALPLLSPSLRGNVHLGFLIAAFLLTLTVKPLLAELKQQHPTYRVRVVGHSLGAGVAVPFTLLVRDDLPDVRAVVFGVPACVSESLVPETLECVTSFVNPNDPLPSLAAPAINKIAGLLPEFLTSVRLVPPGRLLHLCADDGDTSAGAVCSRFKLVDYSYFEKLVIQAGIVESHVSEGYEASFSALRRRLRDRLRQLEASRSPL